MDAYGPKRPRARPGMVTGGHYGHIEMHNAYLTSLAIRRARSYRLKCGLLCLPKIYWQLGNRADAVRAATRAITSERRCWWVLR